MSVFLHPISISAERPLDPTTLAILELIDQLLRKAQIPYMLVGATARDLLLYHVHGHVVTRATYDVDFAVLVDSWAQFGVVKRLFLDTPGFTDKGRNTQRLYYQPTGVEFETIIDIIPFGKLETADRTVAWPPDADIVMNVAAFSDVFKTSATVAVRLDLLIPVPSLAGLTVLKLFAWLDRNDGKDVQDLRRLLETYTDSGNADRLYEEEAEELEFVGFDTVLAGAFLLGKDAQLVDQGARESLSAALTGQRVTALVQQMARAMNTFEDRTEASTALLREFFRGMGWSNIL